MVTQLDHLQALYNRYKRERDEHMARAKDLENLMAATNELIKHETGKGIAEISLPRKLEHKVITLHRETVPVTKLLKDFISTKSPGSKFRNPDAVAYMNSKGYSSENLDSSSYETLRRMVSKGELSKDGIEFITPAQDDKEKNSNAPRDES